MSNLEDWYEGLQVFKGSLPTANIGGGAANQLLVQTAPGVTDFVAAPTTANTFLEWDGNNFSYASITSNTRTASLTLFQWSSSTPTSFPSGTSVYTWATSAFTLPATLNGWSALPGSSIAGQTLYACSIRHTDNTVTPTSTITWNTTVAYAVGAAGHDGVSGITGVLTNDSFTLPASNTGVVSVYTNSGTEIHVYDGSTELNYDGSGLSTGNWKVTAVGTNISAGTIVDSGAFATVNIASGMSSTSLTATILYTITGVNLAGALFSFTKTQTFTKAIAGDPGSSGSAMNILPNRPTTFTSTDGNLDINQSDIILTANIQNLTSPTIVWTFNGFQTSPTSSGTANQTITSTQFGTAKSATVTCTVNGIYTDTVTVVRLEKSTAAAGATKNTIYNQTTAPTGGSYTTGDLWVDTDAVPTTVAQWQGSSWVIVSTYTNNTSQLTDGAGLGTKAIWSGVTGSGRPADNATVNNVTYSSTAPSSPVNGDIWVDISSSTYIAKVRVSGAWQTASNLTTNTNQLTDGAGLGTTSLWSGVSGSGKPEDGATNGATFGININGQILDTTAGTYIKNGALDTPQLATNSTYNIYNDNYSTPIAIATAVAGGVANASATYTSVSYQNLYYGGSLGYDISFTLRNTATATNYRVQYKVEVISGAGLWYNIASDYSIAYLQSSSATSNFTATTNYGGTLTAGSCQDIFLQSYGWLYTAGTPIMIRITAVPSATNTSVYIENIRWKAILRKR